MLYSHDPAWWTHHAQDALQFAGLQVTSHDANPFPNVLCLRQSGRDGFDPDPGAIRTGGNSGYQAVHIAIHAGARRILLLGFDMHGDHFFGRHPAQLRNTTPDTYTRWIGRFEALKGRGAEIINCTPGSALTCFPQADLQEVLES